MSEVQKNSRRLKRWIWVLVAIAVPVGYVLSYGFYMRLIMFTPGNPNAALVALYKPIAVAARTPLIGKPLTSYVNLWMPAAWDARYKENDGIWVYPKGAKPRERKPMGQR